MPSRIGEVERATARRLRGNMTIAETMLWRALRNRGIGAKFRRQVPIGAYVADFACLTNRLIVELDGSPHDTDEQNTHDKDRDAWLRAQGWRVLRFRNDLVIGGGNLILDTIKTALGNAGTRDPSPVAREKVAGGDGRMRDVVQASISSRPGKYQ